MSVATLIAKHGFFQVMPEVLRQITIEGKCPNIDNHANMCRAKFTKETVLSWTKPEDMDYARKLQP